MECQGGRTERFLLLSLPLRLCIVYVECTIVVCLPNAFLHLQIKSIERKISKQTKILDASNVEERTRALQEIEKQQQELADIYQAFTK